MEDKILITTIKIFKDYSKCESAGALGTFQINDIEGVDGNGLKYSLVQFADQGYHYQDNGDGEKEVLNDIRNKCQKYNIAEYCDIETV